MTADGKPPTPADLRAEFRRAGRAVSSGARPAAPAAPAAHPSFIKVNGMHLLVESGSIGAPAGDGMVTVTLRARQITIAGEFSLPAESDAAESAEGAA